MFWKEFFFFSKGEKNGLLVLAVLVAMMVAANLLPMCCGADTEAYPLTEEERQWVDSLRLARSVSWSDTVGARRDSVVEADSVRVSAPPKREVSRSYSSSSSNKSFVKRERREVVRLRVELNGADTTELKQLRGIGSVLSARIVKYRNAIGGFRSVEQLRKVYGLSEETYQSILPHVWVDSTVVVSKKSSPSNK